MELYHTSQTRRRLVTSNFHPTFRKFLFSLCPITNIKDINNIRLWATRPSYSSYTQISPLHDERDYFGIHYLLYWFHPTSLMLILHKSVYYSRLEFLLFWLRQLSAPLLNFWGFLLLAYFSRNFQRLKEKVSLSLSPHYTKCLGELSTLL